MCGRVGLTNVTLDLKTLLPDVPALSNRSLSFCSFFDVTNTRLRWSAHGIYDIYMIYTLFQIMPGCQRSSIIMSGVVSFQLLPTLESVALVIWILFGVITLWMSVGSSRTCQEAGSAARNCVSSSIRTLHVSSVVSTTSQWYMPRRLCLCYWGTRNTLEFINGSTFPGRIWPRSLNHRKYVCHENYDI